MKDNNEGQVFVRVRILVEVKLPSHWGSECTLDQIMKAGEREGPQHLQAAFQASGNQGDFVTIGAPEVLATVVRKKP